MPSSSSSICCNHEKKNLTPQKDVILFYHFLLFSTQIFLPILLSFPCSDRPRCSITSRNLIVPQDTARAAVWPARNSQDLALDGCSDQRRLDAVVRNHVMLAPSFNIYFQQNSFFSHTLFPGLSKREA